MTFTVYSMIWYQAQRKPLANVTWDTILVHFVQMLLNSFGNWSMKLVVLESLNKLLYMLFFVSFGNFSPFYKAFLYTNIHVLYIIPVICKDFNTYGLRIHFWMLILFWFVLSQYLIVIIQPHLHNSSHNRNVFVSTAVPTERATPGISHKQALDIINGFILGMIKSTAHIFLNSRFVQVK